ncbi:glycosyltransferase [Mesoterricola sediminis]|uniref:Glycosyl transferase family 1 n=1 Tax=Mesoterricola sediminis TaxID=2927980 RepID=A0AA48HCT8_9BACT|nr:glycosyltransferase [Mesoterricola sediminis]BDU75918.1 glycosyl transferase family 1 [Mesoterricola sediminis]
MTRLLIVTTIECTLRGFLLPYARHFRSLGWQVDGLAKGATQDEACRAAFDHCFEADWSRNPLRPQGLFRMPAAIRRVVEAGGYDLVHVHTPVAAFLTRFALRGRFRPAGTRVVYTAHGFHFHDRQGALANAAFAGLERLAGPWTDRLVVINRTDEAEALRRGIVDADRLRYMPGIGLDLRQYDPGAVSPEAIAAFRASLGLGPQDILFCMVAGFQPGKRHRDLLQALADLPDPRIHLALAGQGPLQETCRAWCQARGLAGRVHFLGERKDIPVVVRASRALVLPSEREGLSRCVMEAFALGVPVIGADARGVRDLLDACGGLKVPVGDPPALRTALERLAADPDGARALGEAARARATQFDVPNLVALHEALYRDLGVPVP